MAKLNKIALLAAVLAAGAAQAQDADLIAAGADVAGAEGCTGCHTPSLGGMSMGAWYATDISTNPHTGISQWTDEQIAQYLLTGANGIAIAGGPMAGVVENSTQYMEEEDMTALIAFLRAGEPSAYVPDAPATFEGDRFDRGALSYEVNCAACHGVAGEGMGNLAPAFAGNGGIQMNDATNLIHSMLMGNRAPHTEVVQTAAVMPSFAWKMSDQQIVDVLDYIRNAWGNEGSAVDIARVAELRESLGAEENLQGN